jgi:transposase-like protein
MSGTSRRYSLEVRERAVRLVFEHQHEYESQWAAIVSAAAKVGCASETLRTWVRRAEVSNQTACMKPGAVHGIDAAGVVEVPGLPPAGGGGAPALDTVVETPDSE